MNYLNMKNVVIHQQCIKTIHDNEYNNFVICLTKYFLALNFPEDQHKLISVNNGNIIIENELLLCTECLNQSYQNKLYNNKMTTKKKQATETIMLI